MVYFFQIVIFCRKPKHGDTVLSSGDGLLCEFEDGYGFQDRKQWTTEEPYLLASDRNQGS